jgi:hypothetical protein
MVLAGFRYPRTRLAVIEGSIRKLKSLRWRVQPLMAALRRSSVAIVLATSAAPLPPQPHH